MKTLLLPLLLILSVSNVSAETCSGIAHQHESVLKIQNALIARAEALNTHNNIIQVVNYLRKQIDGDAFSKIPLRTSEPNMFLLSGKFHPSLSGPINFQSSEVSACVAELDKQLNLLEHVKTHVLHGSMHQFQLALIDGGYL